MSKEYKIIESVDFAKITIPEILNNKKDEEESFQWIEKYFSKEFNNGIIK